MTKQKHIKPGLYTIFYEQLKAIAKDHGYNLLVHGSNGTGLVYVVENKKYRLFYHVDKFLFRGWDIENNWEVWQDQKELTDKIYQWKLDINGLIEFEVAVDSNSLNDNYYA